MRNFKRYRYLIFPHYSESYNLFEHYAIYSSSEINLNNKTQVDWLKRECLKLFRPNATAIWDIIEITEESASISFLSTDINRFSLMEKYDMPPITL